MDRNGLGVCHYRDDVSSLSARRAWIEIASRRRVSGRALVALRKESVDRNLLMMLLLIVCVLSLSARRAWIEIPRPSIAGYLLDGRSPQGERG